MSLNEKKPRIDWFNGCMTVFGMAVSIVMMLLVLFVVVRFVKWAWTD